MPPPSKYLATYLNDHLLGATAGGEFVRRAARENEGSELGGFLAPLADELEADREALKAIMGELGIKVDRVKVAAGWAAEKVGRLKPNAQLRGYSPLSPLVELEALSIGIQGKLALWRALAEVADEVGLDRARLQELAVRAESQRDDVERHRVQVARSALTAV
jgi:predicted transposase YdaD